MNTRLAVATAALAAVGAWAAVDVRLDGEHLWLNAQGAPLSAVLEALAAAGVDVAVDPSLSKTINGTFTNADPDKVFEEILKPHSYVTYWDVWPGPVGDLTRLSGLQVFEPGRKSAVQAIAKSRECFRCVKGPDGKPRYIADEILVGVKPGATASAFRQLIGKYGGVIVGSAPKIGVYQVRFPPGTDLAKVLADLAQDGMIAHAEPNYAMQMPTPWTSMGYEPGDPKQKLPPGGAARVAVLDSGLRSDSGMDSAIVDRYDAVNPDQPLGDAQGHGTQMALIASGLVTPKSADPAAAATPVVAIRAFDDNGVTSNFALMRAIERAEASGAKVINLSWGSEQESEFVKAAIDYARSKGMVVVAAAGNEPTGKEWYPAAYPGVVAVSAVSTPGEAWSQSNYGDWVQVSAPAIASFPVGHNGPPGAYAGTSIASAYVAGALAQYFTKNPGATADSALAALQGSVTDYGEPGVDPKFGYGTLDEKGLEKLLK